MASMFEDTLMLPDDEEAVRKESLQKEFLKIQSTRAQRTFQSVLECLRDCCIRLHLGHKCDSRMSVPISEPQAEKHSLLGKEPSDTLKAHVTLLGDNVIHAEIAVKHAKTPLGLFKAVAQPEVQWKLQQLQDLGNHIARATTYLCEADERTSEVVQSDNFAMETGELVLSAALAIKEEICAARTAILLPKKKSLLELYNFPPTRRFNPPLPQDQLVSFYISSCKLVCASYNVVSKQAAPQGLSVTVAECHLPYLDEVLQLLDRALSSLQELIENLEMFSRN